MELSNKQVLEVIREQGPYYKLFGSLGYQTLPVLAGETLWAVAHRTYLANGPAPEKKEEDTPALEGAIKAAPIGAVIRIPLGGCDNPFSDGIELTRQKGGWVRRVF